MTVKHEGAGYSYTANAMRFQNWADAQRTFPSYRAVMDRFACSAATAHRWLDALADVRGIVKPRQASGRRKAA